MQQGIHVNGWRLNVKEKTFQVIVSVLIIVLSIYIASKCINTIVKDKAKGNINEAAVQTANFLVGEIIENTSILTQYMIYMENHGDLSEEMKKQILESVVTEYINGSEYSYDTNDPGYKQVVQLIYDKVNATEQPETTQLETVEETTTQPQTKVEEAKKELVPIPEMTGTKYTKDNLGSFKKVIERFYTVTAATTIRESDMPLDKALSEKFKIKGNNKKKTQYSRSICYAGETDNPIEDRLREIGSKLNEISASNNRMANYFSGNWLLTIDELNLQPQRNLYQDIKDGVNNKERPDEDLLGRDKNGRMK